MKTEITEQERQTIEEAAIKYIKSFFAEGSHLERCCLMSFKAGAAFAPSELRKPSEELREKIKELLWSFSSDATVNPDTVLEDIIFLCSIHSPKTDKDLIQQIETLFVAYNAKFEINEWRGFTHRIKKLNNKSVATEIVKLIPSSRCRETDVNVELLEALKIVREALYDNDTTLKEIRMINRAIINAEKQSKL